MTKRELLSLLIDEPDHPLVQLMLTEYRAQPGVPPGTTDDECLAAMTRDTLVPPAAPPVREEAPPAQLVAEDWRKDRVLHCPCWPDPCSKGDWYHHLVHGDLGY